MKKVRLGVIGLGMVGKVHAENLKNMENCDLVAICDVDEKHKRMAETLGTRFYSHYQEMIERERLDGVVIALPNDLHAPVGVDCAKKGIHLFVEKPIASNLSEADRLIEAARKSSVRILVGHHRRFSPLVETTRDIIRGGQIGKLVGVTMLWTLLKPFDYFQGPFSWRREKGGGPILINLIHEIDNLRYICGEVTRVYAEVSHKVRKFPVEDSVSVVLRLKDDVLANIFVSDCVPANSAYESATGESPFFPHSPGICYYFFGAEASITFPQLRKLFYPDASKAGWQYPIFEEERKVVREDPYVKELSHFCKVVAGEEVPRISGEDGRRTLEVTLAVQRSAETGQPVNL